MLKYWNFWRIKNVWMYKVFETASPLIHDSFSCRRRGGGLQFKSREYCYFKNGDKNLMRKYLENVLTHVFYFRQLIFFWVQNNVTYYSFPLIWILNLKWNNQVCKVYMYNDNILANIPLLTKCATPTAQKEFSIQDFLSFSYKGKTIPSIVAKTLTP